MGVSVPKLASVVLAVTGAGERDDEAGGEPDGEDVQCSGIRALAQTFVTAPCQE